MLPEIVVDSTTRVEPWPTVTLPVTVAPASVQDLPSGTTTLPLIGPPIITVQFTSPARAPGAVASSAPSAATVIMAQRFISSSPGADTSPDARGKRILA